jgi:two-component system alkaline phosphatase synthesis response regulator PhoP
MTIIYCIEDDESIRELIIYALINSGYEARGYESGEILYNNSEPDLILLDIMLPGDDGYTILKKLRANNKTSSIPVIMLTSKTAEYDKVKGLDMGADDYIEKPFGVMELISRIKAVLRRTNKIDKIANNICIEDLCIDNERHVVTVKNEEIVLTYKEYELLYYLMRNQGLVITRDKLLSDVWGFDFEGESRTVDVHVRTLRLKLGDSGKLIQTIRSVGYKIGG